MKPFGACHPKNTWSNQETPSRERCTVGVENCSKKQEISVGLEKCVKIAGQETSRGGVQEGSTEDEEMKQQQRMKVMKDTTRII